LQSNKNQAKTKDTKGKEHMNKGFWKWFGDYAFFLLIGFVGGQAWFYFHDGKVPSALEVSVGAGLFCFSFVCWVVSEMK
jgi:hypothetical protein